MVVHPAIIDCDTGRDDVLAILLSLKLELLLKAVICSYGNTSLENVTDNTSRVLSLACRDDIPLWPGAAQPGQSHVGYERIVKPRQKISGNGICNITLPESKRDLPMPCPPKELAANLRKLAQENGPLDYILLGPATNLAAICNELGPDIHEVIARVTMMAGKFDALWDRMPGADFNTVSDPFALQRIIEAGCKVRFVPMNFTWDVWLSLDDVLAIAPESNGAGFLKDIMISQCRNFAPEPIFRFHDPCVICAMNSPEKFTACAVGINCDESDFDFGRISIVDKGLPAEVFETDFTLGQKFLETILSSLGLSRSV